MLDSIRWITGKAQGDWIEQIIHLRQSIWPAYQRLGRDTLVTLYNDYPMYQWLATYNDEVIGIINALPVAFSHTLSALPEEGLHWILSHLKCSKPLGNENYLAAISATVNPAYQGIGLSKHLLMHLKESAREAQYKALIVPARPSRKEQYPLIPIADYLQWKRTDNTVFDPWLRTHEQLGATIAHPCNQSRTIKAPIEQWEQWLRLPLPQTGHYLIQGGLNPLFVNREEAFGLYIEPNVWVIYPTQ